ncbi:MAG: S6e family ribosomal protein [archaeon]
MPFKLNISDKEKAWKLQTESEFLVGKSLGEVIDAKELSADLAGYELEITGASDLAGFPHSKNIAGIGLKKEILTKGWGMRDTREGIRLRKTMRGKILSLSTTQVNLKVVKSGAKKLAEIFPEQNQPKAKKAAPAPAPTA